MKVIIPFLMIFIFYSVAFAQAIVDYKVEEIDGSLPILKESASFTPEILKSIIIQHQKAGEPIQKYLPYLRIAFERTTKESGELTILLAEIALKDTVIATELLEHEKLQVKSMHNIYEKFYKGYNQYTRGNYSGSAEIFKELKSSIKDRSNIVYFLSWYFYVISIYKIGQKFEAEKELISIFETKEVPKELKIPILLTLSTIAFENENYKATNLYSSIAMKISKEMDENFYLEQAIFLKGLAFYKLGYFDSLYSICVENFDLQKCSPSKEYLLYLYLSEMVRDSKFLLGENDPVIMSCENSGKVALALGLYHFTKKEYSKALDNFGKAKENLLDKDMLELATIFTAEASYELSDYESAKRYYTVCAEQGNKYNRIASYGLAWTYFRLGETNKALENIKRLYNNNQQDNIALRAMYSSAYFYRERGKFHESIKELGRLFSLSKDKEINSLARRLFFDTVKKLDDPVKAGDYCLAFANRFGKEAYLEAINFYYLGKRWKNVIDVCGKVRGLFELTKEELAFVEIRKTLSEFIVSNGRKDISELLVLAERYSALPGAGNFIVEAAQILDAQNRYEDELFLLEELMHYNLPDSTWGEILFLIVKAKIKLNELKEAEKTALKLANELPEHSRLPEIFYLIGTEYENARIDSTAIKYFQRVMKQYPSTYWATLSAIKLADIFFKLKKYKEAREFYQYALQKTTEKNLKEKLFLQITETYLKEGREDFGLYFAKSRLDSTSGENKAYLLSLIAQLHINTGELDSAIKYLGQSLLVPLPRDKKARLELMLGELYVHAGDHSSAESLFKRVITESDDDSLIKRARENIARIKEK